MPDTSTLLDHLRARLVVSCQAQPGEPLHGPDHMTAMALAALAGGAAGIRCESPADIRAIRAVTTVPIIGLWKQGRDGVYITPTLDAALRVAEAGADLVAIDATARLRPDGRSLAETIAALAERGIPVMADVATVSEGVAAASAGAAVVSTTLAGYTPQTRGADAPDIALVAALAREIEVPVFAEGRISTPAQLSAAFDAGAWSVVVGGAITRPTIITASFVRAIPAGAAAEGSTVVARG
ncbi:putative N-acetylmannosamine-6-phosphate 2-epimerase [Microcella daejeonensis]|uniref:N-acetylmannosamine-6-phosphate 2-epimerase n=1 Tax=Microcella daejeonensis TaxID=2994971 RepID=UPI0022721456|nr:putative N-acetylmannosamine-6-phosphate 2-epimerase [Microcella daejeonensis]WAB84364.1 putative N-acetylmannosamine-6-phosphate 2-epimerase [Microcella daejeonensis]